MKIFIYIYIYTNLTICSIHIYLPILPNIQQHSTALQSSQTAGHLGALMVEILFASLKRNDLKRQSCSDALLVPKCYFYHFLPPGEFGTGEPPNGSINFKVPYQSFSLICLILEKCRKCPNLSRFVFELLPLSKVTGHPLVVLLKRVQDLRLANTWSTIQTKKEFRRELTAWQAVKLLGRWSGCLQNLEASVVQYEQHQS